MKTSHILTQSYRPLEPPGELPPDPADKQLHQLLVVHVKELQGAGQGRSPVGEGPPLLQLFHLSSPQLWENVIDFLCHDWPIQFGLKYRAWMLAFPLNFKWVRVTHFSSLLQFFIFFIYRQFTFIIDLLE